MADDLTTVTSESEPTNGQVQTDEDFSKKEIMRASFLLPTTSMGTVTVAGASDSVAETCDRELIYSRILLLRDKARILSDNENYDIALSQYCEVFKVALGCRATLSQSFYNAAYIDMIRADSKKAHRIPMFLALVSCCNSIAKIYHKRGDYANAIDWLQEIEVLYDCFKTVYLVSHPVSVKMHKTLEYVTYHMEGALQLVHIFSDLGNTSSAVYFAHLCTKIYPTRYPKDNPEICDLQKKCDAEPFLKHKHPDPTCIKTWDVKDSSLQVRGIWTKLVPRSSVRPPKRSNRVSWIWRNNIYVALGSLKPESISDEDGDAWCIDRSTTRRWRRLPDVPKKYSRLGAFSAKVVIFDDYAWFFSGSLEILRFNMITETWDVAKSVANFTLPYCSFPQLDSYVELYGDKLFVFGGLSDWIVLKDQVFMLLDLKTLKWESLYNNLTREEKVKVPSPRSGSMTWISKKEHRFFLMYGMEVEDKSHELPRKRTSMYELWSYSFIEKCWTRERLRGNFPCHRIHSVCAYHEKQDKLILFGGYTHDPSDSFYSKGKDPSNQTCSMFGDTFVLDLRTRAWQQVVTRSFPAWRSDAVLLIDDTGNIFLHGGMSSRSIHLDEPEERVLYYCFRDTWRLDIEFPGSPLDEKLFFAPVKSFKAGYWRQCWVCGSIGTGYFQCQGSCMGKYIYCSVSCQRSSWQNHKSLHGCRKLDTNRVEASDESC